MSYISTLVFDKFEKIFQKEKYIWYLLQQVKRLNTLTSVSEIHHSK